MSKSNLPRLLFHAGVGGVGKTSVVQKVMEFAPAFGRRVVVMPSITRSVYAKLGIVGEKAATEMSVEQQFELQFAIQEAYYTGVEQFIRDNQDKDLVMVDRSPLDHVSYLLHNMAFHMTLKQVLAQLDHAWDWMASLKPLADKVGILIYEYPEPWHLPKEGEAEKQSSDGFRFDAGGKNFMWNAILMHLVALTYDVRCGPCTPTSHILFTPLHFPEQGMTVDERARFVLEICK